MGDANFFLDVDFANIFVIRMDNRLHYVMRLRFENETLRMRLFNASKNTSTDLYNFKNISGSRAAERRGGRRTCPRAFDTRKYSEMHFQST